MELGLRLLESGNRTDALDMFRTVYDYDQPTAQRKISYKLSLDAGDPAFERAVDWLRNQFGGRLIYSLRSRAEGGHAEYSPMERRNLLLAAARDYDLIDLEAERDLSTELLSAIPSRQRLISCQAEPGDLRNLKSGLEKLSRVEARFYKLTTEARRPHDALAPLLLLKTSKRSGTRT